MIGFGLGASAFGIAIACLLAAPVSAAEERIYVCAVQYQSGDSLYISEVFRSRQGLIKETEYAERRTRRLERDRGNRGAEHSWSNCWSGIWVKRVEEHRRELIQEGYDDGWDVREYTIY